MMTESNKKPPVRDADIEKTFVAESIVGFWMVEPLNALTNLTFFVGAYYLFKFVRHNNFNGRISAFFVAIMTAVGLGSLLWHLQRSEITLLLDRLPIYIFFVYIFYLLPHFLKNVWF